MMLAIILSPNRCRLGKRRARLVRGPRDFSRGIRTQFSRTEGSELLPAAGSRYLVLVVSGVQRFFQNLPTFFSFGIPIEKRAADLLSFGVWSFLRLPSELDRDALRPAVDRRR